MKKEHRKHKKGLIFEDEVVELLVKRQPIARPQLKEYLVNTHKGELGYSEKTIDTKLAKMIKAGIIDSLRFKDFPKYGIINTKKTIAYYILKKAVKRKEDIDKIFKYVSSGDPAVQKPALKEVRRHSGKYLFDSLQLDTLASCLHSKDDDFVNDLLDTLCEYILGRGIEPSNKGKLLEILRELLNRYTGSLEHTNLRRHIFWLLGNYRDYTVIKQIKKDAENLEDPISIVSEYCNEYVAPLIEEYELELFAFKLELKGKERASEFISRIIDSACAIKNPSKRLEKNAELDERIKETS